MTKHQAPVRECIERNGERADCERPAWPFERRNENAQHDVEECRQQGPLERARIGCRLSGEFGILTQQNEDRMVLSETFLENIRVLAIDTTTAGEKDEKSLSPKRTATLELSPEQAEIVAQSQQLGTISLALRSAQDSSDDDNGPVRRRGGVNFVKKLGGKFSGDAQRSKKNDMFWVDLGYR